MTKKNLDDKIDGLLGGLSTQERQPATGISGLALRTLSTEELGFVAGGEAYDEYGGTETVHEGQSNDTRYDGVYSA